MAEEHKAKGDTCEVATSAPTANPRTRRSRNYRIRKGASDPKDLIPRNLSRIGWRDDEGEEIFTRRTLSLTLDSLRAVCGQLGYLPLNIVSIGASSKVPATLGAPQVAILYPLAMNKLVRQGREHKKNKIRNKKDNNGDEGTATEEKGTTADHEQEQEEGEEEEVKEATKWDPFPTTCWLTCPILHARICKLEDKGWIGKLEARLQGNDLHEAAMETAHKAYANYRWALMSPKDQAMVGEAGWEKMLKSVGIAGIRVFNAVKCLHCHYAHFLARPDDKNIIGQWVDELLQEEERERLEAEGAQEAHEGVGKKKDKPTRSPIRATTNDSYVRELEPSSSDEEDSLPSKASISSTSTSTSPSRPNRESRGHVQPPLSPPREAKPVATGSFNMNGSMPPSAIPSKKNSWQGKLEADSTQGNSTVLGDALFCVRGTASEIGGDNRDNQDVGYLNFFDTCNASSIESKREGQEVACDVSQAKCAIV